MLLPHPASLEDTMNFNPFGSLLPGLSPAPRMKVLFMISYPGLTNRTRNRKPYSVIFKNSARFSRLNLLCFPTFSEMIPSYLAFCLSAQCLEQCPLVGFFFVCVDCPMKGPKGKGVRPLHLLAHSGGGVAALFRFSLGSQKTVLGLAVFK